MKIAVITLFPEMFSALTNHGVSSRAIRNGLLQLKCINPRDFTSDRHQTVDDRPYGGGPGMVMRVEPLRAAIAAARQWIDAPCQVIYLSPQGRVLNHVGVAELGAGTSPTIDGKSSNNLVLLCGRYEGVDERLIELEVDQEWSIGDYVLSGGELPAMVLIDSLIRQLPGALGHAESAQQDSFVTGLLDCPHYTRPELYEGRAVPPVLMSGNHEHIRRWRLKQALGRTATRRPELIERLELDAERKALLAEYFRELADEDRDL